MNTAQVTLSVLLALALVPASLGWLRPHRWLARLRLTPTWAPLSLGLLGAAGLSAALPADLPTDSRPVLSLVVALSASLAVLGGGPVTAWVFGLADRRGTGAGPRDHPLDRAGRILRGGAWIGALERIGVFVSLAADLPEGVAVVLGVKALGRYPELRSENAAGTAERFIIGTFTSVLWAVACAGIVRLTLP